MLKLTLFEHLVIGCPSLNDCIIIMEDQVLIQSRKLVWFVQMSHGAKSHCISHDYELSIRN